jgi:hypothetical protein
MRFRGQLASSLACSSVGSQVQTCLASLALTASQPVGNHCHHPLRFTACSHPPNRETYEGSRVAQNRTKTPYTCLSNRLKCPVRFRDIHGVDQMLDNEEKSKSQMRQKTENFMAFHFALSFRACQAESAAQSSSRPTHRRTEDCPAWSPSTRPRCRRRCYHPSPTLPC